MADSILIASCIGAQRRSIRAVLPAVLVLAFAFFALPARLSAVETIVSYLGGTFSANAVADDVAASDLGLTITSTLTGFTATASGGNPGLTFEATSWTTAGSPDPNSSFIFTLQSASFDLVLQSFNVDVRPQGAGPQQLAISYQINSAPLQLFATAQFTPAADSSSIDTFTAWAELQFDGNLTVPSGSTVTFFIAGYDTKNSGKTMQVDNILVTGDVVPEPHALLLFALAAPILFLFRKLRSRGAI